MLYITLTHKQYLFLDSVKAFDTKNMAKGPVFTFEVTIVRPLVANDSGSLIYENVEFDKNALIKRHFVLVPNKVTWASKYHGLLLSLKIN